jgi:hypothetical protein
MLSFKLFPSLGAIDVNGVAHLDIIILSSSGRLGVSMVGHHTIISTFGD